MVEFEPVSEGRFYEELPYLTDLVITRANLLGEVTNFITRHCFSWDRTGVCYQTWYRNNKNRVAGSISRARLDYFGGMELDQIQCIFCHCADINNICSRQIDLILSQIDKHYKDWPSDECECGGIFLDLDFTTPAFREIRSAFSGWNGTIYYEDYHSPY